MKVKLANFTYLALKTVSVGKEPVLLARSFSDPGCCSGETGRFFLRTSFRTADTRKEGQGQDRFL